MSSSSSNDSIDVDERLLAYYGKIVGIFTLVYCIPGAVGVGTVLWSLINSNSSNFKPFSILVTNLISVDFTIILLFIFYSAPCDIFVGNVYGSAGKAIAGTFEALAFTISLFTSFVISANRFVSIFFPHSLEFVFNVKNTKRAVVGIWICAAMWTFSDILTTDCYYVFDEKHFIFNLLCPNSNFNHFFVASMAVIPLYAMGGFYFASLVKLKYDNSKVSSEAIAAGMAKRRMKVFYQAFGIWASILVNVLAYHVISPHITHILTNGLVSVVMILCPSYGSSIIVIIFDSKVRNKFLKVYSIKSPPTTTTSNA